MGARTLRGCLLLAIAALGLLAPRAARAANDCPWLNEATASGILGSEAVGTYTPPMNGKAAVCSFVANGTDAKRALRITVEAAVATPHERLMAMERACEKSGTPLDATGNEAIVCRARGSLRNEYVAGRVRDQVFTITLSTNRKDDPVLTDTMLRMHIAVATEQVTGNLF